PRGRQVGQADQSGLTARVDGPPLAAVFGGSAQLASELSECRRGYGDAAFHEWQGIAQRRARAPAIDREESRLVAVVGAGDEQAVAEVADRVDRNATEGVDATHGGEAAGVSGGIDT